MLALVAAAAAALTSLQLSLGLTPGVWGILPTLQVADSPAYAMVGAAAVLASLFRAPLTGAMLLFELTQNYEIILPLITSAGVAALANEFITERLDRPALGL